MNVAIELEQTEVKSIFSHAESEDIELEIFNPRRFDGTKELAVLVMPMIESIIPFVAAIIVAQITSRRHIKIKIDGIEIQGLNAKNTQKTLEDILRSRKNA